MSLLIASIPNQRVEPRERGVALVVVMMIIIAITGISLWTARQSMLSEGIARNENDQAAAWQAAEAALRDAERDFISAFKEKADNASCSRGKVKLIPSDFTANCLRGLCAKPDADYALMAWTDGPSVSETWWPEGKGGQWNDDKDAKPGRQPVTATNCDTFRAACPWAPLPGWRPSTAFPGNPNT